MQKPVTCHVVYRDSLVARSKHPLHQGEYKLRDSRHSIERWRELVETIEDRIRSGRKFRIDEPLICCMAYERAFYLKKLPLLISELIGYEVLPAIAALGGDGIPKNKVARFLREAKISAGSLLLDCEDTRLLLKTGIAHEYQAMRRGESYLLGLLERTHVLATPQIHEDFV